MRSVFTPAQSSLVNGIMGSDGSSGEMLQIDQIMKRSLLYIWLLPILGLLRLFEASVGSKAGPRCRLNFVTYNTRSMVYKGMVYKGKNISNTEEFR